MLSLTTGAAGDLIGKVDSMRSFKLKDEPVRWTDINGGTHTTAPGTTRSFGLNSQEFYEAMSEPSYRPWIPNGALGRAPRAPEMRVIVERKER